jgi:hypothetical protein
MSTDNESLVPREGAENLLHARPPIRVTKFMSRVVHFAGPFVRWMRRWSRRRAAKRLEKLSARTHGCATRPEIDFLLGHPRYLLSGEGFARMEQHEVERAAGASWVSLSVETLLEILDSDCAIVPEYVACYLKCGCSFDVWYQGNRVMDVQGYVNSTPLDHALKARYGEDALSTEAESSGEMDGA